MYQPQNVLALFGLFAACTLASAAEKQQGVDPKLEGKWIVVSVVIDGKENESLKGAVREHRGNTFTVKPKEGESLAGSFKADLKSSPKSFESVAEAGPNKGKKQLGIYEVDGDKLKLAVAPPGKDRPTAFESKAGSGVIFAVLERAK